MIDFAHVWDGEGKLDDNYLTGLNNIVNILKEFINKN